MYRSITLEEDIALKETVSSRYANQDTVPYAWREILSSENRAPVPEITVTRGRKEETFSLSDVADAIGESLANLLISRKEPEDTIFSEKNRSFVSSVANRVSNSLMREVQRGGQLKLSQNDLYLLIEKALIENDAHDVAKSLVFQRSLENKGEISVEENPSVMPVRLIRRNGNVVPWSETKIENAVSRAFLTVRHETGPAASIAHAVTDLVRGGDSAFVHIEDVQDLVQEELMRQGFFKVAAHYVRYRDERTRMRADNPEVFEDPAQESMVVVTDVDGVSAFWDGSELKKRIQFAMIGLKLSVSEEEIEKELRRSIGAEISAVDLKQTIILNSKTLLEKDSEMAKFSGRILLSYIYEEVLPWNIQTDGVEALKAAHRDNFKAYLLHGAGIKRVSQDIIDKYDIDRLADALDPTADLDFEFLGIQSLYDRYLNVDKTGEKDRRMETPQYFWMRVSMGLFKAETSNAEDWVIRLQSL